MKSGLGNCKKYTMSSIIVGKADVYYEDDEIYLANFEIYKKYRGKGYSIPFLKLLIVAFHIDTLVVRQSNKVAIRVYKKCGFEIRKAYYSSELNADVYYMKRY